MGRKSGWLHVALYLKQCASCLMTAYGGYYSIPSIIPVPVSLTRSGYPRIIPSFHRFMIYVKDDKADLLVKVYMSFFSLSKFIELAKKVARGTFKSIVSPWDNPGDVVEQVGAIKENMKALLCRYIPCVRVSILPRTAQRQRRRSYLQ